MVFNRFFFKVLFRVLLLVMTITAEAVIFARYDLFFTQIILAAVIIGQVVELNIFLNSTNYELSRFIASLKDGDFTVNFSHSRSSRSFKSLHASFNDLAFLYRRLETDLAVQYHFLNQLVDQIEVGIIVFKENGEIKLANKEARRMLQIPDIVHWQSLKTVNTEVLQTLFDLPDVKNYLLEVKIDTQEKAFSVSMVTSLLRNQSYRFCSLQDIKSEIQEKEMQAWQKMTRVLTHEVMNSVTPLVSLSETVMYLLDENEKDLSQETSSDIREAIQTIHSRSKGMLRFVGDFRKLARVPQPVLEKTDVQNLIESVTLFLSKDFQDHELKLKLEVMPTQLLMDRSLIEQVMINLLNNAIDALTLESPPSPLITITSASEEDYYTITFSDNGPGIAVDKLSKIFIPFFTTKKAGSGVGLSLSRQIMHQHGGELVVQSELAKGASFIMRFPRKLVLT